MRKSFLIGNFLPAYGSSFGRIRTRSKTVGGLPPEKLSHSFKERSKLRKRRRGQYIILLQAGVAVSLAAAIGVFHVDLRIGESDSFAIAEQEIVQMEEIVQTRQIEKPPPPPRPPVPVIVPDDVTLDDDELNFDSFLDLDEALAELPPPPEAITDFEETEPEIFVIVEDPPTMVGGMAALFAEVKYPEIARRAGLVGRVVVEIIIDENGQPSLSRIKISVNELLDNEAVRAIMLQTFIPGKQRGRPVKVYMNIPVDFRLN